MGHRLAVLQGRGRRPRPAQSRALAHHRTPHRAVDSAQVVEAFLWNTAPRFLLRDRDGIYRADFRGRVESMGIEEPIISARSPWQSPYVERLIGSVRRECLDNVAVLSGRRLRRILKDYFCRSHPLLIQGESCRLKEKRRAGLLGRTRRKAAK